MYIVFWQLFTLHLKIMDSSVSSSLFSFVFNKVVDREKTCNISRTKPQKLNVSRLILQLSLPNPLKPGVKSRIKM